MSISSNIFNKPIYYLKSYFKYRHLSLEDLSKRFKHPLLKKLMIDFLNKERVDAVITDLILQNADGFYLIEQITKLDNPPKIMITSAIFEDNMIKRAFAMGVSYYMIKPFELKDLEDKVKSLSIM